MAAPEIRSSIEDEGDWELVDSESDSLDSISDSMFLDTGSKPGSSSSLFLTSTLLFLSLTRKYPFYPTFCISFRLVIAGSITYVRLMSSTA